jgi:WhiB family transcriptional regulator, redox-sensing transcriptional regulator
MDEKDQPLPGFKPPELWVEQAVCAQTDPEAFFPEKGESAREALRVCSVCPVREPCLEEALNDRLKGVWGGTTERARTRIRAERRSAARRTETESTKAEPPGSA